MAKTTLWGETVLRRGRQPGGALVRLPQDTCPDCGAELVEFTIDEPALIRHGGYGATRSTTTVSCPCGYHRTNAISETRP